MNLSELLKGMPKSGDVKKVTVVKLSPLDELSKETAEGDMEKCEDCGKPMDECECSEDGGGDLLAALKAAGVDLSKLVK